MRVKELADAVEKALPPRRPLHHHEPYFDGREVANLRACALAGLNGSKFVSDLELKLADYCGRSQALATNTGTAALHLAVLASGIKAGEEVLVPSLTWVATANAIRYVGAVPHFVDGDLNLDVYKLQTYLMTQTRKVPGSGKGRLNPQTGRVISGIIGVDLLGFPLDWAGLEHVADQFGLVLIEDAAQALGSRVGNKRCGSYGLISCFSFNLNKIVTANGGGMILTNDEWIAAKACQLATQAKIPHQYRMEADALAYNYSMNNINAAMALAQFDQIDQFLKAKKYILAKYKEELGDKVEFLENDPMRGKIGLSLHGAEPNYWLTTILVEPDERDPLLDELHKRGVQARALFTPLHKLPIFEDCPRAESMRYCEQTQARAISLPSGVGLCVAS